MVRPKKYQRKTEHLCISIDPDVLDIIRRIAKEHNLGVSETVTDILNTVAQTDYEYANMMAKKYARKLNFWKGEKERLKE